MTISLDRWLCQQTIHPSPIRAFHAKAQGAWAEFRAQEGLSASPVPFLTAPDGNAKLAKSGIADLPPSFSLSLAQGDRSGLETCPHRGVCFDQCVADMGHGSRPTAKSAREVRTRFLHHNPTAACTLILHELKAGERKYGRIGCRLNTFSDLRWERFCPSLFTQLPNVDFYDYTKHPARSRQGRPLNYTLAFSASEKWDDARLERYLSKGELVAVVFDRKLHDLPETYLGYDVADGDKHDFLPVHGGGKVLGLAGKLGLKGKDGGGTQVFLRTAR